MTSKQYKYVVLLIVFLASMLIGVPTLGQGIILEEAFDDPDLPGRGPADGAFVAEGVRHIESSTYVAYPADWGDLWLSLRLIPLQPITTVIGCSLSYTYADLLSVEHVNLTLQEERDVTLVEIASVNTTTLDGLRQQALAAPPRNSLNSTGIQSIMPFGEGGYEPGSLPV